MRDLPHGVPLGHRGSENGAIEVQRDGKTFIDIKDYGKVRELFYQLPRAGTTHQVAGDYEAGKALIETYGVQVDRQYTPKCCNAPKPWTSALWRFHQPQTGARHGRKRGNHRCQRWNILLTLRSKCWSMDGIFASPLTHAGKELHEGDTAFHGQVL